MATLTEFLLNIFSLHWSSNLTVPIKVAVLLIFSALIDQFAITECLLSVNERNLFPCCHQSHYRPTLRHSWPPAPASVSPSTGHFVSHPGVTPGPITSCMVTTHTRVSDIRRCSMQQTLVTPGPRVFVLAVYTPSTSSSTWPRVRNIRTLSQTSMCVGHRDMVSPWTETKTMAAWCRECELWADTCGNQSHWEAGAGTRGENKNAAETDNSINIPLNSNQRINYQQIPLFAHCQQIVRCWHRN